MELIIYLFIILVSYILLKEYNFDKKQKLKKYFPIVLFVWLSLLTTFLIFSSPKLGNHIAGQLIRSGSSPALNYGEAQSAESRKDFVHKLKIILKELKESRVCLKIAKRKPLIKNIPNLVPVLKETEELIAIIFKSIETAKSNMRK